MHDYTSFVCDPVSELVTVTAHASYKASKDYLVRLDYVLSSSQRLRLFLGPFLTSYFITHDKRRCNFASFKTQAYSTKKSTNQGVTYTFQLTQDF